MTPLQSLTTEVKQLPELTDYHNGRVFHRIGCPDNILLFGRKSAAILTRNSIRHHHHRYLLIFALKGEGTLILNQKPVRFHESSAILIHPLQFHHYTELSQEEICWLFITFEGGTLNDFEQWKDQPIKLNKRTQTLLSLLLEGWNPPDTRDTENLETPYLLALLLFHLARRAHQDAPPKPEPSSTLLHKVEQWLRKTPSEQWSVSNLATSLGSSERHLRRCFQEQTRIGIGRFVQEQKVIRAMNILRKGGRVSDAATAAGYDNPYVFSRAFRRMFGLSPSQYRRERG